MRKYRKWLVIFLIVCPVLLTVNGCGTSKEEKMLDGTWVGQLSEVDEDGDQWIYNVTMAFDVDKVMKTHVDFITSPYGKVWDTFVSGEWMADDESISFLMDESTIKVTFTDSSREVARDAAFSLEYMKHEIISELAKDAGRWTEIKIYSLSSDKLTIDFDGSRLTLRKQ